MNSIGQSQPQTAVTSGDGQNTDQSAQSTTNNGTGDGVNVNDTTFSGNDFTDPNFLDTDFDFGTGFDTSGFDFGLYLAEFSNEGDDEVEVGV
jgi:hypothetical protein